MHKLRTLVRSAFVLSALSAAAATDHGYLFTSFRGNGDGLHLAYSFDGKDWTDLTA